jgi:DNA-binding transcriptional regulator YiaG
MKFELADKDLKIVDKKFVQLPMARFVALTEYVEDLEDRLLAAEVNLREDEKVGQEMENMSAVQALAPLPEPDVQQVENVLQRLDPAELDKAREEQQVSVRKLAILTGIPYASLYRYLKGQACPTKKAKDILFTLNMLKEELAAFEAPLDYKKMQKQFQKNYTTDLKQRG